MDYIVSLSRGYKLSYTMALPSITKAMVFVGYLPKGPTRTGQ